MSTGNKEKANGAVLLYYQKKTEKAQNWNKGDKQPKTIYPQKVVIYDLSRFTNLSPRSEVLVFVSLHTCEISQINIRKKIGEASKYSSNTTENPCTATTQE